MSAAASSHPDPKPLRPAGRSPRAWIVLVGLFTLTLAADLVSKRLAFAHVADEPVVLDREVILADPRWRPPVDARVEVIPRILDFRLVLNRGAVFGLGQGRRVFFISFTVFAIAVGLFVFTRMTEARDHLTHAGLAFILAGAAGNMIDRVLFAAVRDFLNLFPGVALPFGWSWPDGSRELYPWVFNIADVLLLAGIGILMFRMSRAEPDADTDTEAEQAETRPPTARREG